MGNVNSGTPNPIEGAPIAGDLGRVVPPQEVDRRLDLFRFVFAPPKGAGGDSLQIAFRVPDEEAGRALLARMGLAASGEQVQRPDSGPFAGSAVIATLSAMSMRPDTTFLEAWLVRDLGLDQQPREIRLLGFQH